MKNRKTILGIISLVMSLLMITFSFALVGCGEEGEPTPKSEYNLYLDNPNRDALKAVLEGKSVSILGDSISTYAGITNDTSVNNTMAENDVFYNSLVQIDVNETWWMQVLNYCGMDLLVNNSNAGSSVTNVRWDRTTGFERCTELHKNVGETKDPDIIIVYMGANDYLSSCYCADEFDTGLYESVEQPDFVPDRMKFEEACPFMMYKLTQRYANSEIFVFTVPRMIEERPEDRGNINDVIRETATHYGATIIELSGTKMDEYEKYCSGDGVHPNLLGMDAITEQCILGLERAYLSK